MTALRFKNRQQDFSLFEPIRFETNQEDPVPLPVSFANSIRGFVPLKNSTIFFRSDSLTDSLQVEYAVTNCDTFNWQHNQNNRFNWMNKTAEYQIVLIDSLNRLFKTRKKQVHLKPFKTHLPLIVGLAEFNNPTPFPITSLPRLLQQLKLRLKYDKNVHIRFIGHACGIPPRTVNNRFSNVRAQKFQQVFLKELKKFKNRDPELYHLIIERLDKNGTIGKGSFEPYSCILSKDNFAKYKNHFETDTYQKIQKLIFQQSNNTEMEPFIFKLKNGKITLIGDNETAEGRQVNRRIEIELFFPERRNGK